jgi:hypothetical protein
LEIERQFGGGREAGDVRERNISCKIVEGSARDMASRGR